MLPSTLGVIGLGAVGGSVAWAGRRAGIGRVVGYAASVRDGADALRAGAITEAGRDPQAVARRAELVVLAVHPGGTLQLLERLAPVLREREVLVTDVTSVKRPVVERARALGLARAFAGSHPLAGSHESGFSAARAERFAGAVVYVTPLEGGEHAAGEVADFWRRLGAHAVTMPAAEHDALLAWTSHLPQAVASALGHALATRGPEGVTYGPGALATTRLAASNVDMWTDVLLLNRERLVEALDGLEDTLGALRAALAAGDAAGLRRWLERAAGWRRRFNP